MTALKPLSLLAKIVSCLRSRPLPAGASAADLIVRNQKVQSSMMHLVAGLVFAVFVPMDFFAFDREWAPYYASWHIGLSTCMFLAYLVIRCEEVFHGRLFSFYRRYALLSSVAGINAIYVFFLLTAPDRYRDIIESANLMYIFFGTFFLHRHRIQQLIFNLGAVLIILPIGLIIDGAFDLAIVLFDCHVGSFIAMTFFGRDFRQRLREEKALIEEKALLSRDLEKSQQDAFVGIHLSMFLHEVKNTLMMIDFITFSFSSGFVGEKEREEYLSSLKKGVEHMRGMIEDFLSDTSGKAQELRAVELETEIEHAVSLSANLLRGNLIDFRVSIPEKGTRRSLMCRPRDLTLVAVNIVKNAANAILQKRLAGGHGENSGLVTIDFRVDAAWCTFTVKDDGVGMPQHRVEAILSGVRMESGSEKGFGIGTRVVHGVCRRNNFTLDIESREGEGTTVTVVMSLLGPTETPARTPVETPVGTHAGTHSEQGFAPHKELQKTA